MGAVAAVAVAVSAPALGDAQQCQRMYELHSLCGLRLALPVRKTHFSYIVDALIYAAKASSSSATPATACSATLSQAYIILVN